MIADKKREKKEKENRRTKETKKGSQNMIKACIFDLDGTIADTVESIAHAVNRVLEHFGLVPRPVEAFNFYAGDGFDLAVGARFKKTPEMQSSTICRRASALAARGSTRTRCIT